MMISSRIIGFIGFSAAILIYKPSLAAQSSEMCVNPIVENAVKAKVIIDLTNHTNFGSIFDLSKSNFKIIDASVVSVSTGKLLCEGRFITSFFVKEGVVEQPKTMTAISSIARYEIVKPDSSDRLDVNVMHEVRGEVLVCYHDGSCGPMEGAREK